MTIFFKLPPISRHLLITDKFLRSVYVRFSEVSLYFFKKYRNMTLDYICYLVKFQFLQFQLLFKSYIQKCTLSCTSTHYDSSQRTDIEVVFNFFRLLMCGVINFMADFTHSCLFFVHTSTDGVKISFLTITCISVVFLGGYISIK